MTNRLIELHDSDVLDVTLDGDDVVIAMSAYVHESEGRPGIDAGTGWTQPVRVTVIEGRWSAATKVTGPGARTVRSRWATSCSTTRCPRPWKRRGK